MASTESATHCSLCLLEQPSGQRWLRRFRDNSCQQQNRLSSRVSSSHLWARDFDSCDCCHPWKFLSGTILAPSYWLPICIDNYPVGLSILDERFLLPTVSYPSLPRVRLRILGLAFSGAEKDST